MYALQTKVTGQKKPRVHYQTINIKDMSARSLHFQPKPGSGSQHREHRSKKGRDPMYRLKRKARVKHLLKSEGRGPKKYDFMRWTQELGG